MKTGIKGVWAICLLPFLFFSCTMTQAARFDRAVTDAAVVEKKDINTHLVAITPENKTLVWNADKTKILVVMWKSRNSFEKFYKGRTQTDLSENYVTWVTAAPQVKTFARTCFKDKPQASKAEIDLRLKQYLGLKPEWAYDVFVELWVSPGDLFRPCVDPEIDDTACNVHFSEEIPKVKGISCYPCFYKNLYFEDFRTRPGVPWTGMGYTYDWGNPDSPFGAAEFILVPGAVYEIVSVVETMDYIRQ